MLQADALLARAQNADHHSSGQQAHTPSSCLNTGKRSLGETFRSITDRSRGTAVSARAAPALTSQQGLSVSGRQRSTSSADDLCSTLAGSSEDSRSSPYSSQSGSSYSSRSGSPSPKEGAAAAQVSPALEAEAGPTHNLQCSSCLLDTSYDSLMCVGCNILLYLLLTVQYMLTCNAWVAGFTCKKAQCCSLSLLHKILTGLHLFQCCPMQPSGCSCCRRTSASRSS